MLMAGLDGIQNKIRSRTTRWTSDIYALSPGGTGRGAHRPRHPWTKPCAALEDDQEFLLKGDVFTQDVIDTWLDYKRGKGSRRNAAAPASLRVLSCTTTC